MNWEDAELKLKGKPDGSFLVRDSSDPRYILSLSFRSQGVTHHTRMEHYRGNQCAQALYTSYINSPHKQNDMQNYLFPCSGTFSLWCHPKFEDRCHSVVEFIERAIMHSKNGKFLYFLRSRVPGNFTLASCWWYLEISLEKFWLYLSVQVKGDYKHCLVLQDSHRPQCNFCIQYPASVMSNPCSTFAASASDSLSA